MSPLRRLPPLGSPSVTSPSGREAHFALPMERPVYVPCPEPTGPIANAPRYCHDLGHWNLECTHTDAGDPLLRRSWLVSCGSARGASNSRSPQPVLTPTDGGWPPPASSQPLDASPRRRQTRQSNPPPTGDPKRPIPSAQTAPGTRSFSLQSLRNHRRVAKTQAPPMRNAG
jgi:hypothetical protein